MQEQFRLIADDLQRIRVGIKGNPFVVDELKSGSLLPEEGCDRFNLSFQLAENTIKWEVIFDRNEPNLPPDVVFGPDDEDFCPDLNKLKGYYDWDYTSETCLSDMLSSLFGHYVHHQRHGISTLPVLSEQWKELCETSNYTAKCETYHSTNGFGTHNASASFLFEFIIDTSRLPPYLIKENLGEDSAALHISFQPPNFSKITPQLYLSPRLRNAVGGSSSLRLPHYGSSDLKSYIEKIDVLLASTVRDISERFERRKILVAKILSEFHGAVIEYDASGFKEISLLLSHCNIFFILYVVLGDRFPESPPVLVVQSTYHMSDKGPYRQTYKEYPYSPRWDSIEIVEAIRKFLNRMIPEFKKESFRIGL
ncbi:BRISC and BRCA1-A complex member 2-like [Rhopilema esculentum]|uniref:BRISC and BRCA1-A complex member 2-like n=1 Tax=Rhopilema esculentum TaxID=499914 RepID=UPI0031CE72CA